MLDATTPVSLKLVPDGAATSTKPVQLAPRQRSTRYPVTPTLSVAAVQLTLICVLEAALAARLLGAVGALVSGAAGVVADAIAEYGPRLPAASTARTR